MNSSFGPSDDGGGILKADIQLAVAGQTDTFGTVKLNHNCQLREEKYYDRINYAVQKKKIVILMIKLKKKEKRDAFKWLTVLSLTIWCKNCNRTNRTFKCNCMVKIPLNVQFLEQKSNKQVI